MTKSSIPGDTGDRIEFVAPANAPTQTFRRFGDDARYEGYFKALTEGFAAAWADPTFQAKLDMELTFLARRPSSLLHAARLTQHVGGAQIYLKREDASPRDTHLIIAVVGQALLAQRMGRKTLVTATADGRRGVLVASIAARLGMQSVVFMDNNASAQYGSSVFRMWLLGAELTPAVDRRGNDEDPREAALQYCARHLDDCFLVLGLEGAREPYPLMLREFAATIGREGQRQLRNAAKRAPDLLVARGGNNADALGLFPAFLSQKQTRLVCVEPAEEAVPATAQEAARQLSRKEQKVAKTILEGLEYPSVVREHGWFKASGRVEYVKATQESAKRAIRDLGTHEGFIPAIETAYAIGWACEAAAKMSREQVVAVLVSEDVEKDIWDIGRMMGAPM